MWAKKRERTRQSRRERSGVSRDQNDPFVAMRIFRTRCPEGRGPEKREWLKKTGLNGVSREEGGGRNSVP